MIKDICLNKSYIELWENDLKSIQQDEEIRIISGEAFWYLNDILKKLFTQAKEKFKAEFKMIAGPIISIGEETRTNAILELAERDIIKLWISPFRQLSHYRIFGRRFIYKEDYHPPLSSERCGQYIHDNFVISKFIYDFDNLIDSLEMKLYKDSEFTT